MQTSRIYLLVIGCLLAAAVLLGSAMGQDPKPTKTSATPVAVCDIVEVFNNYQRAKDLNTQFDQRIEATLAEDKKRSDAIEAIRMELEGLKEGSKEYERRFKDAQRLELEREAWRKLQDGLAARDHHRLTREMYRDILAMIARVAKAHGIGIVLYRERRDLQSSNLKELLVQMAGRKVLYSEESVDLTEEVLAGVNRTYRSSGRQ